MKPISLLFLLLATLSLLSSCKEEDNKFYDQPAILSVSSLELLSDEDLTITGENFLPLGNIVTLEEGNYILQVIEESRSEIKVRFPADIVEDQYTLTVRSGKKAHSYEKRIKIFPPNGPIIINGVSDQTISTGDTITISGHNFLLTNNAVFLTDGAIPLNIVSENRTEIKARIPIEMYAGEYMLFVRSGSTERTAAYDNKIVIEDSSAPMIFSLQKEALVRGSDSLVAYGKNFAGSNATLLVQRNGSQQLLEIEAYAKNDGVLVCSTDTLKKLDFGRYTFSIKIGNRESSKQEFILIRDGSRVSIVGLKTQEFCTGTFFILDAANFSEADVSIRIDVGDGSYISPSILSCSVVNNAIIVSADGIPARTYNAIEVFSNGQSDRLTTSMKVTNCGTPAFVSLDRSSSLPNSYIEIAVDNASALVSSNINQVSLEIGGVTTTGDVNKHYNYIRFTVPETAAKGVTDIKVYRTFDINGPEVAKKLYFIVPSFTVL